MCRTSNVKTYPSRGRMLTGIDVSSVQDTVPWAAVKARGTTFAVVKCGNGNDGHDPDFDADVAAAERAGLVVGAYHFVYCGLPDDPAHPNRGPVEQCDMHFEACSGLGGRKGELPPCIDAEWPAPQDWAKWHVTAQMIKDWLITYLEHAEASYHVTPILYTYPDFANHVQFDTRFAKYPLWAAEYSMIQPIAPWPGYTILQTAGGTPSALSHRFQQPTTLPNGVPVDTDIITDDSVLEKLLAR
jgi:lysozyme